MARGDNDRIRIAVKDKAPDGTSLYGAPVTAKYGSITHSDKFGTDIAMRSAAPPPVSAYDEYLARETIRKPLIHINQVVKTGFRLRRVVVMRRQGATWKECGAAVGVSGSVARSWVESLPTELGV